MGIDSRQGKKEWPGTSCARAIYIITNAHYLFIHAHVRVHVQWCGAAVLGRTLQSQQKSAGRQPDWCTINIWGKIKLIEQKVDFMYHII